MLEYNPKVDYLFPKKIIKHKDSYNQDESYYRDVFYKNINEIRDEKALFLNRMSIVIEYLKDTKQLSIDSIKYVLNILDFNVQIKEELLSNIIKDTQNNYNPYSSINALINIIKENIFNDEYADLIMSSIIHNYINFHNGVTPVIFDYESSTLINKCIKENKIELAKCLIIKRYAFTNMYNHKNKLRSKEEVISILVSFYNDYKEKYEIDSIYIYGSYLRGTQTEYSDIDLYMVVSDRKFTDNLRFELISILRTKYDLCADLSIEKGSNKLTNLTQEQKRELTKII